MSEQHHLSQKETAAETAVPATAPLTRSKTYLREQKAFELSKQFARLSDITSLAVYTVQQLEIEFDYYQIDLLLHNQAFSYSLPQLLRTNEALLINFARAGQITDVSTVHSVNIKKNRNLVTEVAQSERIHSIKISDDNIFLHNKNLPRAKSECAIPLLDDRQLLGVLNLYHTERSHFDEQELRILQIVGTQLAIALAKAELFAQNQHFQKRQSIVSETAESLLNIVDLPDLWPALLSAIKHALEGDRAAIYLVDGHTNTLYCPHAINISETYINHLHQHYDQAPGRLAHILQNPVIIDNIHTDPDTEPLRPFMVAEGFQAYAVFPLIPPDDELLHGFVVIYRDQLRPFTPEDINIAQTLTNIGAITKRNINLLQNAKHNLRREEQLNHITHTLSSALDLPSILGNVIRLSARLIGADAGLLGLIIEGQIMTFYPYNLPPTFNLRPAHRGKGLAWQIVDDRYPIELQNYPEHPLAQEKWIQAGVTNFIGVPLNILDDCLGALMLFNFDENPRHFTKRDMALLESIGRQAATAIQNARMYAEAQQRANALIQALNRQAELDELKNKFVQSVSHELRTPLGIIYGHVGLLEETLNDELDPMQKQSIEIIGRRAKMLADLVEDLTALLAAETQELRRDEINPVDLAYSLIADYQINAMEKGIELKSDIKPKLPMIKGDITQLRRVFDNLVSNAFKFTPEKGSVTIRVWAEVNDLIIEVADSGEGIPEDQLKRIFERFYQVDGSTKRKHGGTGLGLALVKEIIEAHRGHVSVQSEVGVGTTFNLTIPGYWPEENA